MNSLQSSKTAYELWHGRLEVDHLADTPWHRLVKAHISTTADLAGKKVLEIGCGRGGFACWIAAQDPAPRQIVAADFSAVAVQKASVFARHQGLSSICWEVADIQAIAHENESFDTVISCETIEHVPEPAIAVRELARVLKPGGKLFLTTPNYMGTMGLYRIYLRLCGRPYTEESQPINHVMHLPRTRSIIAATGLRIKAIDGVGHYLPFPGRPPIEAPMFNDPRSMMRWIALHSLIVAEKVK